MSNITNFRSIVFFDTETVCLKPHQSVDTLLSLSMIKDYYNGETERKDYKFKLSGPKVYCIDEKALQINGYNEKDWEDAVDFKDVAREIAEFIHDTVLVAHNITFDLDHLENAFKSCRWEKNINFSKNMKDEHDNMIYTLGRTKIDTKALAYLFLPVQSQSLNALREHLDISIERAHSADTDTEDCRSLFYHILSKTHPAFS